MNTGKSLIKFIIIIILLIGIIALGIQYFLKELENKQLETIHTDMLLIQAKAKIVFETYHVDKNNGLQGEKVEEKAQLGEYGITADETDYYVWNREILDNLGLKEVELEEGAFYIINYDTEEVIYSKGYETKDGTIYYKLTDIKGLI